MKNHHRSKNKRKNFSSCSSSSSIIKSEKNISILSNNSFCNKNNNHYKKIKMKNNCNNNERKKKKKKKKKKEIGKLWMKIIILMICINMIICILYILPIIIKFKIHKKNFNCKSSSSSLTSPCYKYELIYHEFVKNDSSLSSVSVPIDNIIYVNEFYDTKKSQDFPVYVDHEGSGFIRMITNDEKEEEEKEYEISGECICCYECEIDDNCKNDEGGGGGGICVDNVCVECQEDNDCKNNDDGEIGISVCNKWGKCVNGYCKDDDECKRNEKCNFEGYCVEGCRIDEDCGQNQICDRMNGECVNGCRNDNECTENGKICRKAECVDGCRNNFDCSDFDNVCINDLCISTDESKTCNDDVDCTEEGYYCNYEYMICVSSSSRRIGTSIYGLEGRRNKEMIPAVCSLYGIISLFLISTSIAVISKSANDKLNEVCLESCDEKYSITDEIQVNHIEIKESKSYHERHDSECKGYCKSNQKLKNEEARKYTDSFCHKKSLTAVVSAFSKEEYYSIHDRYAKGERHYGNAHHIFRMELSTFCQHFRYTYYYINMNNHIGYWKKNAKICSADNTSIKCNQIR